ncbi:MAG TPA: glycosyltransferase family 2 protein [Verrucomicrobiae bacterium]|nr:glycosyltransferase family 2 protein [Verrucomicrobiae bacterium]
MVERLPKISVITPSFNSLRTIRETIESVTAQQYPNLEHIVMDGGSTDGTLDLLKGYPHLAWYSEKDEGHYHAMNKGIQRATGEVVVILNADDCFCAGVLKKVGEAFARHPEWDGLFGDIRYVDGDGKEIYRRQEAKFDYNVLRFSGTCYVIHQTLFVRRKVHDRLGLYRHQEFKNACDYDFILKLGRAGCRIGHVPAYVVNYRYHDFGQSADLRVMANLARERTAILKEHGCPGGLAGKVARVLYRLKRQAQKVLYRGRCDLIPGTWHLRRHYKAKTSFSSNIGLDQLPVE